MKKNKDIKFDIEQIVKFLNNSDSFLLITDMGIMRAGSDEDITAALMAAILQSDSISEPFELLMPFFVRKGITYMREKASQMKMKNGIKVVAEPAKSELDIN